MLISALLIWPLFDDFFTNTSPELIDFAQSNRGIALRMLLATIGFLIACWRLLGITSKVTRVFPRYPAYRIGWDDFTVVIILLGFALLVASLVVVVALLKDVYFNTHPGIVIVKIVYPWAVGSCYVLIGIFEYKYPLLLKQYERPNISRREIDKILKYKSILR